MQSLERNSSCVLCLVKTGTDIPPWLPFQFRPFWHPSLRKVFIGSNSRILTEVNNLRERLQNSEGQRAAAQNEAAERETLLLREQEANAELKRQLQETTAAVREHSEKAQHHEDSCVRAKYELKQERLQHQATRQELGNIKCQLEGRTTTGLNGSSQAETQTSGTEENTKMLGDMLEEQRKLLAKKSEEVEESHRELARKDRQIQELLVKLLLQEQRYSIQLSSKM